MNRYGFQTEASGQVKLKFSIMRQKEYQGSSNRYSSPELRKASQSEATHDKVVKETNYALERAKIRLATLKSMDTAPAHS